MWQRVVRRVKRLAGVPPEPEPEPLREIAPTLVATAPLPQNALDVFQGEWISTPPPGRGPQS